MNIKHGVLGVGIACLPMLLTGCKDVAEQGPSGPGAYTLCSFTRGLQSDGHWSARVSYPCETDQGPFPAITLTGGFTNVKEQMYWVADHLTEHGFIVNTMTTNNPLSFPPSFAVAHKAGYDQILEQNLNSASPIYNRVDTANLGMLGYSYGGAGALLAANELGDHVQSVAGMAPVFAADFDLSNVAAPNLVLGGANDASLGPPAAMDRIYGEMPAYLQSAEIILNGVGHIDFINTGNYHHLMLNYIVSWFTLTLKHDAVYMPYLNGNKHQEYVKAGNISKAVFDL